MSQLIASHWSAFLFWNNDGRNPSDNSDNTREKNARVDPPPGLPPQHDNNQVQNDDNDLEPFNIPPSSPHPPDVPVPDDPHTPHPGLTLDDDDDDDDDPFHTPFQSPPRPNHNFPDDEMHSPQAEPPDLPPFPSSPPNHPQPPFPGTHAIHVAPDTVIVPNKIILPNIDDTPMTRSTERPPDDPPIPPATKARPSRQMPPASSTQIQPSSHLVGDPQPSVTPNATTQPAVVAPNTSKAKTPKDVAVPDDFDDNEPDPDAGPSGHNGPPLLPLDGDE